MRDTRIWEALQIAVVCLVGYVVGSYVTALFNGETASVGGLWSAISGLVVLQATTHDTWRAASLRVLGSLLGAVIAVVYLSFLPFSPIGMAVTVGLTFYLCQLVGAPQHGRLGAITVAVIMVLAGANPQLSPVTNGVLRFVESCIGTGIALAAVAVTPGKSKEAVKK